MIGSSTRAEGLVDGRFRIRRFHRRGGMGELYDAWDHERGERVALKLLRAGSTAHERFEREGALLATLDHPGIVRHIAHGVTPLGQRYLAMEWLEGEDLAERLRRERLTIGEIVALGIALGRALGAAHARGIIHRDLKPRNIFLPDFRPARAKLIDFGLARSNDPVRELTRTGVALGTRGYMAPEQVAGDHRSVGPSADLFSLGCVLYECAVGVAPFEADDSSEVLRRILFEDPAPLSGRAGLPPPLVALVTSALEKDPADRPASAAAVVDALEAIPIAPRCADGIRATVLEGADVGLVRVVGGSMMDIGKHPSATLALRDTAASRFHCEVTCAGGVLCVRDLGSTNGLTIDGVRVTRSSLRDGAVLGIGTSRVRIARVADAAAESDDLERARRGDMNVLLEGDHWDPRTFAEALHNCGLRRRALCVPVYGAALRVDDLAALSGGTLLVEEAEALGPEAQQALFEFVTTRTVLTPRGRVPSDVRIITHAGVDLRGEVNAKRFRPDLFHVLAGIRLRASPS
jgi:hypothetical protein